MSLNILIIPDKFKGTLTAQQAAEAIARGWRRVRPQDSIVLLPMSDGGDGFGEIMSTWLEANAKLRTVKTVNAAHQPCVAKWWWSPATTTALIESASVIGLAMLPPKKFHPFELDTLGLGAVITSAAQLGATRCLMGIGGSATNDAGFGLARALGWQFLDSHSNPIEQWVHLHRLARIHPPKRRRWFRRLSVAVDVQNPFLGRRSGTRTYGPQKGLTSRDVATAEHCMSRLAAVVEQDLELDLANVPGTGAAGGLGFGLMAFLGADLTNGFELFAREASLQTHLRSADLVITGEGSIDESTFMGKAVGQVASRCRELAKPCIAVCGALGPVQEKRKPFTQLYSLVELAGMESALKKPKFCLETLARRIAAQWA